MIFWIFFKINFQIF